jgi:hypothetical protein
MLLLRCEEDRPLSLAEAAQARSALAALPDELRAHAFGGAAAASGHTSFLSWEEVPLL